MKERWSPRNLCMCLTSPVRGTRASICKANIYGILSAIRTLCVRQPFLGDNIPINCWMKMRSLTPMVRWYRQPNDKNTAAKTRYSKTQWDFIGNFKFQLHYQRTSNFSPKRIVVPSPVNDCIHPRVLRFDDVVLLTLSPSIEPPNVE